MKLSPRPTEASSILPKITSALILTAVMIGCHRDDAKKVLLKAPEVVVPAEPKNHPKKAANDMNRPNLDFNTSSTPDTSFDEERAKKDRKYVEAWLKFMKKEKESTLKELENDPVAANALGRNYDMGIKELEEMLQEHDRKNNKKE